MKQSQLLKVLILSLPLLCLVSATSVAKTINSSEKIRIIRATTSADHSKNKTLEMNQLNSYAVSKYGKPDQIKKSDFTDAIKDAIKTFEKSMKGTCAQEMTVSLKVEAKGKWAIVEVGIGSTVTVKINNPDKPDNCSG